MIRKAYAKLNLAIDVLGRREDGYHYVDMVSIPLDLHDFLEISELNSRYETFITADDVSLVCDESNLVHKAFVLMKNHYNLNKSYRIQIYKMIPTQAGLAGGSSDAACLMRAMSKSIKGVTLSDLAELGKEIGADVPFCIHESSARVQGVGEQLTLIENNLKFYVLIVKPNMGLATSEVYTLYDEIGQDKKPDIQALVDILSKNPKEEDIAPLLYNGLRKTATTLCPDIQTILDKMKELGLVACEMSGSGSACFALSSDSKKLEAAAKVFSKMGYKTFITHIHHKEN